MRQLVTHQRYTASIMANVSIPCQSWLSVTASFVVFNAKFCCGLGDALASSANDFERVHTSDQSRMTRSQSCC